MVDKIEEFLFDILGLILPGLITIFICIFLPFLIIDFSKINMDTYLYTYKPLIFSFNDLISSSIFNTSIFSWQVVVMLILISSYILGHTIKVFSKYQYELLEILFDELVMFITCKVDVLLKYINDKIKIFIKCVEDREAALLKKYGINSVIRKFVIKFTRIAIDFIIELIKIIIKLVKFVIKIVRQIFCFGTLNNYDKKIESEIKPILSQELNLPGEVFGKWYNIYKFANIILEQQKIKTLSFTFLAKYNFYRSLSFIFFINTGYIFYEYLMNNCYISQLGQNLFPIIVTLNFLLWFTFHYKYKRYWALCGNESLLSLYYYLQSHRKDIKKEDE